MSSYISISISIYISSFWVAGHDAICLAISFVLTNQLLAPISTGCLRLSPLA